jgi:hypothetical protein
LKRPNLPRRRSVLGLPSTICQRMISVLRKKIILSLRKPSPMASRRLMPTTMTTMKL